MYETIYFLAGLSLWVLCPFMIGLILLQGGAGDISSAFGGGGQLDSALGVGASRKMAKLTGWLAAIFLIIVTFLALPHKGSITAHAGGVRPPTGSATAPAQDAGRMAPMMDSDPVGVVSTPALVQDPASTAVLGAEPDPGPEAADAEAPSATVPAVVPATAPASATSG